METETFVANDAESHPIQAGIKIAAALTLLSVGVYKLGGKAKAKFAARKAAKVESEN